MNTYFGHVLKNVSKLRWVREFSDVDRRALARMTDKELAAWQSKAPENSPQWILAGFEWQSRINREQNKVTMRAAWLGVFGTLTGTLAGTILGFALGLMHY